MNSIYYKKLKVMKRKFVDYKLTKNKVILLLLKNKDLSLA